MSGWINVSKNDFKDEFEKNKQKIERQQEEAVETEEVSSETYEAKKKLKKIFFRLVEPHVVAVHKKERNVKTKLTITKRKVSLALALRNRTKEIIVKRLINKSRTVKKQLVLQGQQELLQK